jgi:hypothetical protein
MMMIKKLLILFVISTISGVVLAQDDDFGLWFGLNAKHEILKNTDVELSGSLRTFNNSSRLDEAFLEGGIQYRFNKYFSTSASYRLTSRSEDNSEFYFRHKLFLSAKGMLPLGNFSFSGRLMLQRTTKTYIEDNGDLVSDYTGRFRLKSYYNIPSFPVNPYLYLETFTPLFSDSGFGIGKYRLSGGAELKINRKSSMELEYIFQRDYKPDLANEHIISINYKIRF